jgi:hypothetical protein
MKKNTIFKRFCVVILTTCFQSINAKAYTYDFQYNPDRFGNLSQNDPFFINLVGANVASVACGPVAATNGLKYCDYYVETECGQSLTNGDLYQTATTLCNMMGTSQPVGTEYDDFIWYKRQFIENGIPEFLPIRSNAQYDPSWAWQIWDNPSIVRPSWAEPTLPTWEFLWYESFDLSDI